MRVARNVADPNAPFSVRASASEATPKLAKREPLLDVNDVPLCTPAQLTLFESRAESNGAQHVLRYTIQNVDQACRLAGFPSLSLLRADGSVLGDIHIQKVSSDSMAALLTAHQPTQPDTSLQAPSPQILLPAKGEAAFQLGWTSGPDCEQVSRIVIATPGMMSDTMRSVLIPRSLLVCEDKVLITAVSASDSN